VFDSLAFLGWQGVKIGPVPGSLEMAGFGVATEEIMLGVLTSATAKDKERNWQTGKVLDSDQSRRYVGSISDGSTTEDGTTSHSSGSSTAIYRVHQVYVIEVGQYVYVSQERLRWKWSKPADLTVNAPVKVAIEKNTMYLIGDDGKEHEAEIVKKTLKEAQTK
jgi:hypothetical protein